MKKDPYIPDEVNTTFVRLQYAAEQTGIPESTLKRHLLEGSLAGQKVGPRLWWIRLQRDTKNPAAPGLEDFIQERALNC